MTKYALLACILAAALPAACLGQSATITLPPGTPLPIRLPKHLPMKAGEPIRAELLYPVYQDDKLVLPARTILAGTVVALTPDRARRRTARLRADFTPFHKPVVRFDSIIAPNGASTPITTNEGADGAPIYRVVRAPAPTGGFIGQYFHFALQYLDDGIQSIIGPGKADRLLQFIYSQLPYHPERISTGTAWTVETAAPVTTAALPAPPPVPIPAPSRFRLIHTKNLAPDAPASAADEKPTWIIQAYLDDAISSEDSTAAQTIRATVAEPVLNPDGSVAVPTGSVLTGSVTQARPARHFTRAGVLRFNFSEIQLPGQQAQRVRTSLAAADSTSGDISMNAEGEVKPKPQDKILVPALLILLASRPQDHDHRGGDGDGMVGRDAAASSGLGLITLIVGAATQQANFATGIGAYSAALSIYPRYFGKGAKVAFPKDTRIVIQTTATRSSALKPAITQP